MFCSVFVVDCLADERFKLCSVLFLLWTVWPTRGVLFRFVVVVVDDVFFVCFLFWCGLFGRR